MKKVDTTQYVDFTFICSSFRVTTKHLEPCAKLFNERGGECMVVGRKSDGEETVIDAKE